MNNYHEVEDDAESEVDDEINCSLTLGLPYYDQLTELPNTPPPQQQPQQVMANRGTNAYPMGQGQVNREYGRLIWYTAGMMNFNFRDGYGFYRGPPTMPPNANNSAIFNGYGGYPVSMYPQNAVAARNVYQRAPQLPLRFVRQCVQCKTTSTPLWRNGPRGPKTLCNACGIRYKKNEARMMNEVIEV